MLDLSVAFHNGQAGFKVLTRIPRDVFHAPPSACASETIGRHKNGRREASMTLR